MPRLAVTSTQPYEAWQIVLDMPDPNNATAPNVLDVFDMMSALPTGGYTVDARAYPEQPTGDLAWIVTLHKDTFPDQTVFVGDFVVFDGTTATRYSAADYAAKFIAQ